jgi:hypothetical protein
MQRLKPEIATWLLSTMVLSVSGNATTIPRLTFEQITDQSELIVTGEVTRSWTDWDAGHQFIWTRHEVSVSGTHKGRPSATVIVSEPGGAVNGLGMAVAGSVAYQPGESVVVFLQRVPNGNLRTAGWGQGKYLIDRRGRLHATDSLRGVDLVSVNGSMSSSGTSLKQLDGMSAQELSSRISARLRTQRLNGGGDR